jgi:hypothetical protein
MFVYLQKLESSFDFTKQRPGLISDITILFFYCLNSNANNGNIVYFNGSEFS